jgi:hypothetical protein
MRPLLLIALFLSACAAPPAGLLAPCVARTVPPQPPKAGTRNLNNITAWANQIQLAREATDRALADCSTRHAALVEWVQRH